MMGGSSRHWVKSTIKFWKNVFIIDIDGGCGVTMNVGAGGQGAPLLIESHAAA